MTDTFDAVLAEMQNCHFNGASRQTIERWADRLAAARTAEIAAVDEAMVASATAALMLGWNLHYPDANRMAKCALTAATHGERPK